MINRRFSYLGLATLLLSLGTTVVQAEPLFRQTPSPTAPTQPSPRIYPRPSTLPQDLSISTLEREVFEQINGYRRARGLSLLILDRRVSEIARMHSQNMASRRVPVGHTGMRQRTLMIDRLIPSRRVSENVAYIFTHNQPANRAVAGWLKSPRHRPAIEDRFQMTGIGVAQDTRGAFYFTQIFVRPR